MTITQKYFHFRKTNSSGSHIIKYNLHQGLISGWDALGRDGTRIQWDAVGLGPKSVGRVPFHPDDFGMERKPGGTLWDWDP